MQLVEIPPHENFSADQGCDSNVERSTSQKERDSNKENDSMTITQFVTRSKFCVYCDIFLRVSRQLPIRQLPT